MGDRLSKGLLIQNDRGRAYYVVAGNCRVYEGDTIYIDTDATGYPGNATYLYKNEAKTTVDCDISSINSVTGKILLVEVLKTNSEAIVNFKNEDFLIEYGIGCRTTLFNYVSHDIFLNLEGAFDGVGDGIVLANGDSCEIWTTKSLGRSTTVNGLPPCPPHSHSNPEDLNTCICNQGYELNDDMTACKAVLKCPAHSTGTWGNCLCDYGYVWNGAACKNYGQTCKDRWGKHALGDKKSCYCEAGYVLNAKKNYCVKNTSAAAKKAATLNICGVGKVWTNNACR